VKEADTLAGAKKKDSPDLTAVAHGIPDTSYTGLEAPAVYFEDEPEYDQYIEPVASINSAQSKSDLSSSVGGGKSFASGSATIERPASSRRLGLLAVIFAVALAVALFTAYFTTRSLGSIAQEVYNADTGVDEYSTVPSAVPLPESKVVVASKELEASSEMNLDTGRSANPSMPSAAGDYDELSQIDPVITPVTESSVLSVYEGEAGVPGVSSAEDIESPEALNTASRAAVFQGSTISVNFSFDSDELDPESHAALDHAVVTLREHPGSIAAITGFTDNQGDEEYNLVLSRKRADAVKQYLVSAGIEHERLRVEGRGANTEVAIESGADVKDSLELHRVVQIELSSDARK
jgi:outer membrane protein OmpA-like peptidoglycan-associated protein